MLLKQSNPEHAINSIAMEPPTHDPIIPRIDPLDDVFGSDDGSGASPPFLEGEYDALRPQHHHEYGITTGQEAAAAHNSSHPSDIRRLQQEHATAGYRDGVTVSKAGSIQAGFDEGFGLGATIGLTVGRLLGVLEGIAGALAATAGRRSPGAGAAATAEIEAASGLLADARAELDARSVFGEAYWNADGTWKYVVDEEREKGRAGEGAGEDVVFSHVVGAHPLVRKWRAVVDEQMRVWGVEEQLPLLQRKDGGEEAAVAGAAAAAVSVEPMVKAKGTTQTQGGARAPSAALSW